MTMAARGNVCEKKGAKIARGPPGREACVELRAATALECVRRPASIERINARAPNVMNSIKELINDASTHSLTEQLAQERNQFVKNLHHANAAIGIQAFLNKEAPHYK
jgi:enoyl-CoA hydratase/carnithine racemase